MAINDIPDKIPYVGVGCIVIRDGQLVLVQNQRGFWSTPGGHLDFGESPDVCAARETLEETGISVANVEFVAITNDVLADAGRHYLTVWMRGDADSAPARIGDAAEINQLGWFAPGNLHAHCTSTFKICLKVVVGLDHLQTCNSQFHQSPNKTT